MATEPTTWAGSRRMRLEIAFVVSAVVATAAVFGVLMLLSDEGPIAEDGGDDPGPLGLLLTMIFSVWVFVAAVALVVSLEVALWVTRRLRRRRPDHP